MTSDARSQVTALVTTMVSESDPVEITATAEELMLLVYPNLRRLASSYLAHERAGHTLQPTALGLPNLRIDREGRVSGTVPRSVPTRAAQTARAVDASADPAPARVSIDYPGPNGAAAPGDGSGTGTSIDNPWCGYEAVWIALEAAPARRAQGR